MRILWGFDVDETLIITNHELDKKSFYTTVNDIKFRHAMYELYTFMLKYNKKNMFILTSRPPVIKKQLSEIFKIETIYTNDIQFKTQQEFEIYNKDRYVFNLGCVEKKLLQLDALSNNADYIYYFDDLYKMFEKFNRNPKIKIMQPL